MHCKLILLQTVCVPFGTTDGTAKWYVSLYKDHKCILYLSFRASQFLITYNKQTRCNSVSIVFINNSLILAME